MKNASAQERIFDEKLLQLAATIDDFEGYANSHGLRIANLSEAIAQKFHLSPHDILILRQAALVHDIGEFAMNREYVKAGRSLNDDERTDMQRHPVLGEQEAAKRGLSRAVQLLVRWHHEWWNGSGYPDALKNEQIPLGARILRAADTYCALTDTRPHRKAFSETEAKQQLKEWAGIEFDPQTIKFFLELEMPEGFKSFQTADNYA